MPVFNNNETIAISFEHRKKNPKKVKGLPIISRNLSIKQIIFECLVMNKNRQLYRVYRVWHNN